MIQLMPLPSQTPSSLALLKSRLVLPLWYRLTQVAQFFGSAIFRCFFQLPFLPLPFLPFATPTPHRAIFRGRQSTEGKYFESDEGDLCKLQNC